MTKPTVPAKDSGPTVQQHVERAVRALEIIAVVIAAVIRPPKPERKRKRKAK